MNFGWTWYRVLVVRMLIRNVNQWATAAVLYIYKYLSINKLSIYSFKNINKIKKYIYIIYLETFIKSTMHFLRNKNENEKSGKQKL